MSEKKLTKLYVNRTVWLNERTRVNVLAKTANVYLYRPVDGKMCCLGIYLNQLGVPQEKMRFVGSPSKLFNLMPRDFPEEAMWLTTFDKDDAGYRSTCHASEFIKINDDIFNDSAQIDLKEREEALVNAFAKYGIEVIFEGAYPDYALDDTNHSKEYLIP